MNFAKEIATLKDVAPKKSPNVISRSFKKVAMASVIVMSVFNLNVTTAAAMGPDTIADMVEENLDAVVNISTMQTIEQGGKPGVEMPNFPEGSPFEDLFKQFFDERSLKKFEKKNKDKKDKKSFPRKQFGSLGSGFVISDDGYVVTNAHVIADADEINVTFSDGEELVAKVIGADKKTDIALLKVEADKKLKYVEFGSDEKLRIGSWVVAIGNPFGLGVSVSAGIVSAKNRNIQAGPYDDFIQTDAGINKGNSGGPLFNLDGEVVGVNTALISPTGGNVGIGFSVPASTAMPVIEQLKEYGTTRRGWLGVMIQNVTDDIADSFGMDKAKGAFVSKVFEDSPAAKAGVQPQDIILEFNGQEVPNQAALPRIVANTEIDKEVIVKVLRGGEEVDLDVKVGLLEQEGEKSIKQDNKPTEEKKLEVKTKELLGLELQALNKELIEEFKLDPKTQGLMIVGVDGESVAAEKMLRPGDRVLEAAQTKVKSIADLEAQIEKMKEKGRRTILLLVEQANDRTRFVALPMK